MTARVLSLDGGGVKGYLFALCLAALEKLTGRRCHEMFDLIVGTSAGGIVAIALGAGIPAREVALLFRTSTVATFQRSWWDKASNPKGLRRPLYDPEPLRRALVETLGNMTMGDMKTKVMVTALDVRDPSAAKWGKTAWAPKIVPVFMDAGMDVSDHHLHWLHTENPLLAYHRVAPGSVDGTRFIKSWRERWEKMPAATAALATSAAPTYFPAVAYQDMMLVDGGVYANNPATSAFVEAMKLWPEGPWDVLSIGSPAALGVDMDDASPAAFVALASASLEMVQRVLEYAEHTGLAREV